MESRAMMKRRSTEPTKRRFLAGVLITGFLAGGGHLVGASLGALANPMTSDAVAPAGTGEPPTPWPRPPGMPTRQLTVHGDPPDPTEVSDELKRVYRHIDANFDTHVDRLREWIKIPSISNLVEGQPGIWDSALFLRDLITEALGCQAEIHHPGIGDWGTPGNPVVYGRCDVGAEKTIIDYVMADVMPIWPEEDWPAPPFGGQIIEKPPYKRVLVGRGASNQKGHEMAQLNALISIKATTGTLPVNMIFIVDHDEERAEIGIRSFMMKHPELFEADAVFGLGAGQGSNGQGRVGGAASIGNLVFDLETHPLAGLNASDGMSPGVGLWLPEQPMWRHMQMLQVFAEDSELRQQMAEGVIQPSPPEMEYLRRRAESSGRSFEEILRVRTGVRVAIMGTWGGNMVPGYAGHHRPPVAASKMDIRYPPNVDGEVLAEVIRAYLDDHGYADVKMNVIGDVPWSYANTDTEIADAIRAMYRQFDVPFDEPPTGDFLGTATARWPDYLFTRMPLQLPTARGGLGYGTGAHFHPEGEYYVIEGDGERVYGFAGAMKSYATTLYNYAGLNP